MEGNKNEKLAAEETAQGNPGQYAAEDDIMHNDVTGDDDTNGISASMVRFGDMDGEPYAEKLDTVGEEIEGE